MDSWHQGVGTGGCAMGRKPRAWKRRARSSQTRPDIIVLDYSMPVMDGIRAAKSLNQLMPRVPLLLFTVHDSRILEKEALAAGVPRLSRKKTHPISSPKPTSYSAPRTKLKRKDEFEDSLRLTICLSWYARRRKQGSIYARCRVGRRGHHGWHHGDDPFQNIESKSNNDLPQLERHRQAAHMLGHLRERFSDSRVPH